MAKAYGLKIALPGQDARIIPNTAANIKKFSLLSHTDNFSLLKVNLNAKVTLTNGSTTTIAHGLSYTPIFWCFMQNGSGNLVPVYDNTSGTYAYIDATNLTIHNADGATRDFYYYVFYDAI